MRTVKFNRIHKNGWISYKVPGVPGAIFIDKRTVTPEFLAAPPATIDVEFEGLLPEGAGVSELQAAKNAKKQEAEQKKAERAKLAAEKAEARLAKLKASAEKAASSLAKAQGQTSSAPATS